MSGGVVQDIVALFGAPAAGNPAQYLFERAIEAAGLDCRFISCEVEPGRLGEALTGAEAMGFRGCLLAGGLRAAVLPAVEPSAAAAFAEAASLLERGSRGWLGHMTDGRGLVEALRTHVDPAGRRVVLLGAGPTARAIALELALAGAAGLVICDPDAMRAADLVAAVTALDVTADAVPGDWPAIVIPADAGIVISTPRGAGVAPPVFADLRPDLVVAEMTLAAEPAAVGRQALAAGACLVDGLEIHAARVGIDFLQLTGTPADPDVLREALDEFLAAS
jgi:shikimate dehydrogenase